MRFMTFEKLDIFDTRDVDTKACRCIDPASSFETRYLSDLLEDGVDSLTWALRYSFRAEK